MEKHLEYAARLHDAIISILTDRNNEHHISIDELSEENNATEFAHALFNLAPALIMQKLTNEDKDILDWNYGANRLCHQFTKAEDK